MRLPIRVFWLLNNTIARLMAEQNIRSLEIGISSQSSEGFSEMRERLKKEMGNVINFDKDYLFEKNSEPDREGIEILKAMSKQKW